MRTRTVITTALAAAAVALPVAQADAATPTWRQASTVSTAVGEQFVQEMGADDFYMEGCVRTVRRGAARRCFLHVYADSDTSFDCHWRVYVARYGRSFKWWTSRAYSADDECDETVDVMPEQAGWFSRLP